MKIRLPKNRFLRWGLYLGSAASLAAIAAFAFRWNTARESAAELRAEIERLDAFDPGWQWESILAARPDIKDSDNAYRIIAKVQAIPNAGLFNHEPNIGQLRVQPEPMPIGVAEWAGEFVVDRAEAIRLARQLVAYPTGRHPIKYSPDFIGTLLPTVQDTRQIPNLLKWDIRVNAQLGHFDTCIDDLRAIRNAARSFGDEGFLIVMLVRMAVDLYIAGLAGEMLSQGQAPAEGLAVLQREYLEESREPILRNSLRSERAIGFKMVQFFGETSDSIRKTMKMVQSLSMSGPGEVSPLTEIQSLIVAMQYPQVAKADQACVLRRLTEAIDAVQLAGPARLSRLEEQDRAVKEEIKRAEGGVPNARHLLTNLLSPAVIKIVGAETRWLANLRTAATGIAVERFRMANKRWPNSLEELVPRFMERIEEDPYSAKPLLYKKFADGAAVYSVGPDLKDDGGDVVPKAKGDQPRGEYDLTEPTDIGMRLWDLEKRGKWIGKP